MRTADDPRLDTHSRSAELAPHIDAYHDACLSYAERMLGNRADAEDAVQDTWVRAMRFLHQYDGERPFKPWLFRILVNEVRTHLRRRGHWWNRWSDAIDPDTLEKAAGDVVEDASVDALRAAVAELPDQMREAFLLKYVSEMSYAEMEDATGASTAALKMRVKRACDVLRSQLSEIQDNDA